MQQGYRIVLPGNSLADETGGWICAVWLSPILANEWADWMTEWEATEPYVTVTFCPQKDWRWGCEGKGQERADVCLQTSRCECVITSESKTFTREEPEFWHHYTTWLRYMKVQHSSSRFEYSIAASGVPYKVSGMMGTLCHSVVGTGIIHFLLPLYIYMINLYLPSHFSYESLPHCSHCSPLFTPVNHHSLSHQIWPLLSTLMNILVHPSLLWVLPTSNNTTIADYSKHQYLQLLLIPVLGLLRQM